MFESLQFEIRVVIKGLSEKVTFKQRFEEGE